MEYIMKQNQYQLNNINIYELKTINNIFTQYNYLNNLHICIV